MKKLAFLAFAVVASICVLLPAASAQEMFLESSSGFQEIQTCDHFHHVESCDDFHIVVTSSVTTGPGTEILMNGQKARIDWAGEGYKLTNGTIISKATGDWEQIWPSMALVQVSGWQDADSNSYLTVSDQVTVNGTTFAVEDHRYFIWVTPMQ